MRSEKHSEDSIRLYTVVARVIEHGIGPMLEPAVNKKPEAILRIRGQLLAFDKMNAFAAAFEGIKGRSAPKVESADLSIIQQPVEGIGGKTLAGPSIGVPRSGWMFTGCGLLFP